MLTGFALCRAALAVTGISAPEQSVLMVLAIMANEDARCWPAVNGAAGLTGKTKLKERAVQNAVKALCEAGHLTREERPGRGVVYTVHPRTVCTPAQDAPPQDVRPAPHAPTPAPCAPKQPRTTIPQKASPSSEARKRSPAVETFLPAEFDPTPKAGSITAKVMDAWPPGALAEQIEHFTDYHTAKRTKSADWQASWRTWVKNWKTFNGNRTQHDRSSGWAARPGMESAQPAFLDD